MSEAEKTPLELFEGLEASRPGFIAIAPVKDDLLLGKSFEGELVIGTESSPGAGTASFRTNRLDFIKSAAVLVYDGGGDERKLTLDLLKLRSSNEGHVRTLLNAVISNYDGGGLSSVLSILVDLFSSPLTPSLEAVLGLWGELRVIQESDDPEFLINCWHQNWSGLTDFQSTSGAVEVKTSLSVGGDLFVRKDFADSSQPLIILLVLAERSSEGQSVFDLRDNLAGKVSERALAKVDRIFLQLTLGDDSLDCSGRYRLRPSDEALIGIFKDDLPTVREWDTGVSRIKYLVENASQHGSLFGEEAISGITSVLLAP